MKLSKLSSGPRQCERSEAISEVLKFSKIFFLVLVINLASTTGSFSQEIQQGYFRSPVKPGGRNYLSGNFAELRPNHFHTGLDYKFGGSEGEPIYAAADGWVHRIKVSSFGYGNVIYLKHPTGHITLYGHLRNFNPRLTEWMRQKMYEAKQNELEVYLTRDELPVKKGELIANGGNTGSSGGPHLHFEIRDSLDRAMDPLLAGFTEILDNIPPTPQKIAIVPLEIDSRVNGKFQRIELTPVLSGASYRIPETIRVTGKVGLEIQAYDKLDGAENQNGFPKFEVSDETGLLYSLTVDQVDFNFTRHFLLHTHQNRFTRLYHQPNLKFDYFSPNQPGTGYFELEGGTKKALTIKLLDAYNNPRLVNLTLTGTDLDSTVSDGAAPAKAQTSYIKHHMKIKVAQTDKGGLAQFFIGNNVYEVLPAYQDAQSRTYLWDLRFGIPSKIDLCSEILIPELIGHFPLGKEHLHAIDKLKIRTEENSLLEDLYLRVNLSGPSNAPVLRLQETTEYLWNPIELTWDVSGYTGDKSRTHVYQRSPNGSRSFVGGEWEDGQIRFKTRNFGSFVLAVDDVKPTITPIRVNGQGMRFTIKDNLSGIRSFEALVDGKWVLMRYEHKQAVIWSETLDKQPLRGAVLLKVTDMAGNIAEWKGTLS
ncbi:M23 family metallopeptidase [Algoriphagus boritolerans]|uniref:Peptidase family M23 n=1 Tax=Algoriphagus boritolerans DSM 17298 = JCM 18970 TaxID=1120964 RepID=A0A1H5XZS4_9BACT|nr:M23 family metallopeptidase [Algoriphagus boritolerans]SEG17045.1 Peptidase family M23 [Algoriphagus boritolerans DSM 17298 = JCM 18970]